MNKKLDGYEIGEIIINMYSKVGAKVLTEDVKNKIHIKSKEVVNRNVNKVLKAYKENPQKFESCETLTDIVCLALTKSNSANILKNFIRREIEVK